MADLRVPELTPGRDQEVDAASVVVAAMQLAVFERCEGARFEVVSEYPEWFLSVGADRC